MLQTISSHTLLFSPSGMHTDSLWHVLQLWTVSSCDLLSIHLGMPSDSLWCVSHPSKMLWTVSNWGLFSLYTLECLPIPFGLSHNLARRIHAITASKLQCSTLNIQFPL